ncbi:uncharacterized protein LOC103175811 [Callorhinchus milii]|uniref:uncharacterized protein LOC103175811 n=1 Tax=Callorhinchus milii TaxID=7868 RepID=UPI001C3FF2A1|nr:uncharacterized protein LOC103175811 [Callorhinchus milii]
MLKCLLQEKGFPGCINDERATIQTSSDFVVEEIPTPDTEAADVSTVVYNIKDYSRARSPSPPPLSPVRADGSETGMNTYISAFDANSIECNITQPPSLSPEEEGDCSSLMSSQTSSKAHLEEFQEVDGENSRSSESENDIEKGENSVSFQELMERINEKLKSIETSDKGQSLTNPSNIDSYQENNDSVKLREIVTALLHEAKVSDYSLMELLKQHEENRIIQTRFRKRQETLIALHNSPDSPSSRRQTVQIKRDLANLDQLFLRKKSTSDKCGKRSAKSLIKNPSSPEAEYSFLGDEVAEDSIDPDLQNIPSMNTGFNNFPPLQCEIASFADSKFSPGEGVECEVRDITEWSNLSEDSCNSFDYPEQSNTSEPHEKYVETPRKKTEISIFEHDCTESERFEDTQNSEGMNYTPSIVRAKRNVLPPERFSIYITEPRKMFYAASFSENFQRKSIKTKRSGVESGSNASEICSPDVSKTQESHREGQDIVIACEVTGISDTPFSAGFELRKNRDDHNIGKLTDDKEYTSELTSPEATVLHSLQEPSQVLDQYDDKKQNTSTTLNTDSIGSMEHNSLEQPIQLSDCTKDDSENISNTDSCTPLRNTERKELLTTISESKPTNHIFPSQLILGNDCLNANPSSEQKCQHSKVCACSIHGIASSTNKTDLGQNCSFISYNSPVKLMFLSEVSSDQGVKYTLTSVSTLTKFDTGSCIAKISSEEVLIKTPEEDHSHSSAENVNTAECFQSILESSKTIYGEVNDDVEMDRLGSSSSLCASSLVKNNFQVAELSEVSKDTDNPLLKDDAKEIIHQKVQITTVSKDVGDSVLKHDSEEVIDHDQVVEITGVSKDLDNSLLTCDAEKVIDQIMEITQVSKEVGDLVLKRKPGRPKKLGPPVEKQIKRPKGRPPKPKVELSESADCTTETPDAENCNLSCPPSRDDVCNRNIRITVVYGRSRRFKRFVSENDGNVTIPQLNINESDLKQTCEKQLESLEFAQSSTIEEMESKTDRLTPSQTESECGYDLVRPIKNKTLSLHNTGNAVGPNSKPTTIKISKNGQRKPGRPAKVKISGISVTVDLVSPQERKVYINSILPPLDQEFPIKNVSKDTEMKDPDLHKESVATVQNDCETMSKVNDQKNKVKSAVPSRHSVRIRKPSLHCLHSFANSCSFSQSSALVRKSRKLLLNKAGNELAKNRKLNIKMISENTLPNITTGSNGQESKIEAPELNCFSEVSADPIFISSTSFRWWHNSTSKQTLLEELDTQFEKINNGWLPVDVEELTISSDKGRPPDPMETVAKRTSVEDCYDEDQISPIQMLFQGNCDMDKIRAWFMQTTETHSLSIVRKDNARNPIEVLNAKGVIADADQIAICSSSQAEHLKKHLKKFALEPDIRPQGQFCLSNRMSKLKAKRRLLIDHNNVVSCKLQSTGLTHNHRVHCKQWKSVWKQINENQGCRNLNPDSVKTVETKNNQKPDLKIETIRSEREPVLMNNEKENENQDKLNSVNNKGASVSGCTSVQDMGLMTNHKSKRTTKLENTDQGGFAMEEQQKDTLTNVNWKLGSFKECRVFLRKINSLDQSHFRNYSVATAWQPSRNNSFDIKSSSHLQKSTEENSDAYSEVNPSAVDAFEAHNFNPRSQTLCERRGKKEHKARSSNENGASSPSSDKIKHFSRMQSVPIQVGSDHLLSLGSSSNPVDEESSQKENAEIVKTAGKRKAHMCVTGDAAAVKRIKRSSVEQRLSFSHLKFQIGNAS